MLIGEIKKESGRDDGREQLDFKVFIYSKVSRPCLGFQIVYFGIF